MSQEPKNWGAVFFNLILDAREKIFAWLDLKN